MSLATYEALAHENSTMLQHGVLKAIPPHQTSLLLAGFPTLFKKNKTICIYRLFKNIYIFTLQNQRLPNIFKPETMLHTHSCVWVHIIWSTKNRERILFKEQSKQLFDHLILKGQENKIPFEKLVIQPEHIHALINLPTNWSIAEFMNQIKGESSYWLNKNVYQSKFSWQRGYGAYSVSASQLNNVRQYIDNQPEHHKRLTFTQEYEQWKREYGIFND